MEDTQAEKIKDMAYLNEVYEANLRDVKKSFANTEVVEQLGQVLADQLFAALAQQNAKIQLLQTALINLHGMNVVPHDEPETPEQVPVRLHAELPLLAGELADIGDNLYGVEEAQEGLHIRWSGPSSSLELQLPIRRDVHKRAVLCVAAIIVPNYLAKLNVKVNGELSGYGLQFVDGLWHIVLDLPPIDTQSPTAIRITMPGTHSPKELVGDEDQRLLGMAFSRLTCAPGGPFSAKEKLASIRFKFGLRKT